MTATIEKMLAHGGQRSLYARKIQQSWGSLWVLEKMLATIQPDRIVELGTGSGLLACYFDTYCRLHDARFWTIDLHEPDAEIMKIISEPRRFTQGDIKSIHVIANVNAFLNDAERPFLLVDGADPKADDVNLYAPTLKQGTVIFAHDANLNGSPGKVIKWGFTEDAIQWDNVERFEPYYGWAVKVDARMLCMVRK